MRVLWISSFSLVLYPFALVMESQQLQPEIINAKMQFFFGNFSMCTPCHLFTEFVLLFNTSPFYEVN